MIYEGGMRTITETAKKKRGMPSSFTILLALLAIVAVITVIVSGTSGGAVTAARLSDFCTAPILGFADALALKGVDHIVNSFRAGQDDEGDFQGNGALLQVLDGLREIGRAHV